MPHVSVIIPCYNQGAYLHEAVESVLNQTFPDLEIIIVNDGSDDELTITACTAYTDPRIKVITTDNQGLASARNNGIRAARGTFILPLDADDTIAPEYVTAALTIIESEPEVGIVYCRANLFGAVDGPWHLPEYALSEMLKDNIIFCTALFRKDDWELVGGYDPGMIYGWEDYDFWLSLIEKGRRVHQLEGRFFNYRVGAESMIRSVEKKRKVEMFKRIFQRHTQLFADNIEVWLDVLLDAREPYQVSRLYVDCGAGLNNTTSVARKMEPGKRTIRFPIESFAGRKALRFDPAECPVDIELETVELRFSTGSQTVNPEKVKTNAVLVDENRYLFSTDDPQMMLLISGETVARASEVVITCNVVSLHDDVLRTIIAMQADGGRQDGNSFSWFARYLRKKS